jgi:hypothetical protein
LHAAPNFAKIYAFLASLFDPNTTNHVDALDQMSPIDRETVQILMNNLAMNLATQTAQAVSPSPVT